MAPDKDDNYLYDVCIDTKSILVTGDKLLLNYISNPPVSTHPKKTTRPTRN
jgi:predicted nucleic acid-binding protein